MSVQGVSHTLFERTVRCPCSAALRPRHTSGRERGWAQPGCCVRPTSATLAGSAAPRRDMISRKPALQKAAKGSIPPKCRLEGRARAVDSFACKTTSFMHPTPMRTCSFVPPAPMRGRAVLRSSPHSSLHHPEPGRVLGFVTPEQRRAWLCATSPFRGLRSSGTRFACRPADGRCPQRTVRQEPESLRRTPPGTLSRRSRVPPSPSRRCWLTRENAVASRGGCHVVALGLRGCAMRMCVAGG